MHVESTWSSAYGWLTWEAIFNRISLTTMAFGGVKEDVRIDLGEHLLLKLGGEARRLEADYDYFSASRQITALPGGGLVGNIRDTIDIDLNPSGSELAGYLAARVRPIGPLTAEISVRYDRISHTNDGDVAPPPARCATAGRRHDPARELGGILPVSRSPRARDWRR